MSRSEALKKQFKRSVSKARSRGIDSRTPEIKLRDFKKEAKDRELATKGEGRSNALIKQSLQPVINKNQFLVDQNERRNQMLKDFKAGNKVNKSDFTGYTGGLFGLRAGNFEDTGQPKLREGLTGDQYHNYMRQLFNENPEKMRNLFPVGSGKIAANIFTPAPFKALSKMAGDVGGGIKDYGSMLLEKGSDLGSTMLEKGRESDLYQMGSDLPLFLKKFLNSNPEVVNPEVEKRYINPNMMAGEDRFDDIFQEQEFDEYQIHPFAGMMPQIPDTNVNRFGYKGTASDQMGSEAFYDMKDMFDGYRQGYRYNQGGIASLNVDPQYSMLKQSNDFMGGF
jgi:hypothetical protein|tara:strand:+ start:6938 stop:7948 length:1011 start_codon:yes stop_codon:yes gene_type:complete